MEYHHVESVLFLTDACKLDCPYCFVKKNQKRVLEPERVRVFLSTLDELFPSLEAVTFYFQGAEPCLYPREKWIELRKLFEPYREEKQRKGVRVSFHLQSSVFVDPKRMKKVVSDWFGMFDTVSTSFDYSRRVDREFLRKRIEEVREVAEPRGAVVVLTRDVVGREAEIVSDLYEVFQRPFKVRVRELVGAENLSPTPKEQLLSLIRWSLLLLKDERLFDVKPISSYFRHFLFFDPIEACSSRRGCGPMISLSPWAVGPCDLFCEVCPRFAWADDPSDVKKIFKKKLCFEMTVPLSCQRCRFLSLCWGGCSARRLLVHSTLEEPDPFCRILKPFLHYVRAKSYRLRREEISKLELTRRNDLELPEPESLEAAKAAVN